MEDDTNKTTPEKRLTALASEGLKLDSLQSWSDKVPTSRRSLLTTAFVVLFIVFGLGGYWSATAKIGGAVIASGRVIAEGENRVMQHLEGGILKDLQVREGDHVEKGQAIATLDETATRSQLDNSWIDRAILVINLERWRAERDNLEEFSVPAEKLTPVADNPRVKEALESQLNEFSASREARLQQISVLSARISNEEEDLVYLKDLLSSFDAQRDLISQEYDAYSELLKKGLTSRSRVFSLQRELSKLEAQKSNALATVQKSRHNIRSYNESKDQIVSEHNEKTSQRITEAQRGLNDISDVIIRLEDKLKRSRITSPVSGTVFRIPMKSIGAVIKPGDTVAEILPKDAALQLDVSVSPQDISKVFPGQEVDIVFPSDRTDILPPLRGEVTYVSADTLVDQATGMPYYSVHVALSKNLGGRTILPGNVAETFFKTEAKTFIEHMADPITRFASKSFKG